MRKGIVSAKVKLPVGRRVQARARGAKGSEEARARPKKIAAPKNSRVAPIVRDAAGRFIKGSSGNPLGKFVVAAEVRELARQYGPESVERLAYWMRSADPQSSIAAAKILLERGYGKAVQPIAAPNGGALVSINVGAEPVRTAEELQAIYSALMRDPTLDVSALQIDLEPAKPIEHQGEESIIDARVVATEATEEEPR